MNRVLRDTSLTAFTMKISPSWFVTTIPILVTLAFVLFILNPDRDVTFFSGFKIPNSTEEKFSTSDLIPPATDRKTCESRYESDEYRKTRSTKKPSPRLVAKLRAYESLHKRCGPNTEPYEKALDHLRPNYTAHDLGPASDCKYVVWAPLRGLGNRILSLTSTFLYALLTDRVLLASFDDDMSGLFCEPFPGSSWTLPRDFPSRDRLGRFDKKHPNSYGNKNSSSSSSYVYLHLAHDYDYVDKLFFCDEHGIQRGSIRTVPWVIVKSDNYFAPGLFLMPCFQAELAGLFPDPAAVFHLLGKYLLSPSNGVWGRVKRYYRAYLSGSDEILGLQIRTLETSPSQQVTDQILACTTSKGLLPKLAGNNNNNNGSFSRKRKAVLVTSLIPAYSERLGEMYWENPTESGDVIGVYQPSREVRQRTEQRAHNEKAWAEMYLLSLCHVLVTTGRSTFGYVAQGLGGMRPWVMTRVGPEFSCVRAGSAEPCFHSPFYFDCVAKRKADPGAIVPHVTHCEDVRGGIKLVDVIS